MSSGDLDSLLLHVYEQRTRDLKPVELLRRFEQKRTSRPLRADARRLHAWEGRLLEAAADFEALALGPASPLGATRALGGIHSNNVLAAVRGLEVQADPSVWLALEAARRRRPDRSGALRLCASQRVLRLQPLPDPALLPHFQLFACLTARRHGSWSEEMARHARVYLSALRGRAARLVLEVSDPRRVRQLLAEHGVEVSGQFKAHDLQGSARYLAERGIVLPRGRGLHSRLEAEVLAPLENEFPEVEMVVDLSRTEGLGYYCGPVLRVLAAAHRDGPLLHLVDGGCLDWTARLLHDRSEWVFSSGIGVDRLALELP